MKTSRNKAKFFAAVVEPELSYLSDVACDQRFYSIY